MNRARQQPAISIGQGVLRNTTLELFNERLAHKPYFLDDLHFGTRMAGKELSILAKSTSSSTSPTPRFGWDSTSTALMQPLTGAPGTCLRL